MVAAIAFLAPASLLIQGGIIIDGTGAPRFMADIRITGETISEIGKLIPRKGEQIVSAKGLIVAPGFIDAHSHADFGIAKEPTAKSQISQGITTAVVGQDGIWQEPVGDLFKRLANLKPALNFAAFSGHGGIMKRVMGDDFKRTPTTPEMFRMEALVRADMRAGALGLSSGLEYDPGYYARTEDLADLAKISAQHGGLYISHVRDEGNVAFRAFDELLGIGKAAGSRTQISHIKLATKAVWGRAADALKLLGPNATADVYPYTFWQSTVAALSPSRQWEKREIWVSALADVGGPQNVRLTNYTYTKAWVGKNLAEIAKMTGRDAISIIQEILNKTRGPKGEGEESVAVSAMTEADLQDFIAHPRVMFSSDGSLGGTHPRSAGSFPRFLGRYVRELKVLSLESAIRKMTDLPAVTFRLHKRGRLAKGFAADLVIFDPKTIGDKATAENPTALSIGVRDVLVSGQIVWRNGKSTGIRSGIALMRK